MRGSLNVIARMGGRIAGTAAAKSDFAGVHPVKPIPIFLGASSAPVAGGPIPTNATIAINQAVPGNGLANIWFADEFTVSPWRTHQTWQSGDKWSFGQNVGSNTNGWADGPTWWANPVVNAQAAALYPAPVNGVQSLGLMTTPTGIGISQTTMGASLNNQLAAGGSRLFGYHEMRIRMPAVRGFLLRWDIEDFPLAPSNTVEIDLDIWIDANGVENVRFSIPGGLLTNPSLTTIYSTTSLDINQFHVYGVNWQPDHITAYIDGRPVGSIATPGGDFQLRPSFAYFQTSSAALVGDGTPVPATLPAFADIDYYRVYPFPPQSSGVILVHAFDPGASNIAIADPVGQAWTPHPDARISGGQQLTCISINTLPMSNGAPITVSFTNPASGTTGVCAAWYIPYVSAFGSLVNVGSSTGGTPGTTVPDAPSIALGTPTTTSVPVALTLPTTGGTLDAGTIQVQRRQTGTTTWASTGVDAAAYCTPLVGSVTDAFGNVWTIAATGGGQPNAVLVNGVYANGHHATMVLRIGAVAWHVNDSGQWYSFTTTGTIANGAVSWVGPVATSSPLISPGINATGLNAGTQYDFSAYVSNTTGNSPLSAIQQVTTVAAGGVYALTFNNVGQQTDAVPYTVSGTISNRTTIPTLQWRDNAGNYVALPAGASVTLTTWSFTHPAVSAPTTTVTLTTSVRDSTQTTVSATSNSYNVIPTGTNNNATVNFGSPTGKTMQKALFGFRSSIFGGDFSNATFRSTANAQLKPAMININSDWELDRKVAAGDFTDFNNLVPFISQFCQGDVRGVMGVAHSISGGTANQWASRAVALANYLNANGYGSMFMDWNVGTLWMDDGGLGNGEGASQATVNSYFNTIFDALKGVNANYRIWGPAQWHPAVGANTSFANAVGSTRAPNVGICWMSFPVNPQSGPVGVPIQDSLTTAYGPKGYNSGDSVTQRNALSGTPLANAPFAVLDWNMSEFANETGYYMGGVYAGAYLIGLFKSAAGMEMGGLENINAMGVIGAIKGNNTSVSAHGYVLGKAGQSVYGPEYTSSTTLANMAIVAVKPNQTSFAIMLVNYDTTTSRTVNIAVSGATLSGTISRWEIGKNSPGAPQNPTPQIGTQASLTSVSVPSETVVILTSTGGGVPLVPGAPGNLSSPAQTTSSITIATSPPTTGGGLNNGSYFPEFKLQTASNYSAGPIIRYCTLSSGSVTDASNNVWTIVPSGGGQPNAVMVNNAYANGHNALQIMRIGAVIWHVNDSGQWYSFTPTGPL